MLSIDRRFIPKLTCGNILRPHSHSRNLFQLVTQSQNLLLSGCYVDISIVHGSSQKKKLMMNINQAVREAATICHRPVQVVTLNSGIYTVEI